MIKYLFSFFLPLLFLQTLLYAENTHHDKSLENVSIQFKWKHAFQFAGYYAAKEKGFYADEGLHVTLKERDENRDFLQDVVDGFSEYGISDSSLVVTRLQNKPVVLVTQIFQYSPLVFIARRDSNITTPYEMVGKKLAYSVNASGDAPFRALILKTIGDFNKVTILPFHSYQDFIDRKIDVTSAYATAQPYTLKKQGIEVNIIDPKSYGIDFYGDNLFTTQKELKEHPQRVAKMKRATLKGWKYALSHQDEIIDIILKKYAPNKKRDALEFEARGTYQMIMPDLIDLGSFRKEKYAQVAKTYYQLGIVQSDKIDDAFFYHDNPHKITFTKEEQQWLKDNPMIKIALMNFWETDSDGNNIHTDLIKLLNKYGDLNIVPVKFNTWKKGFKEVNNGQHIHAIANLSWSKERTKNLLYTKAYNFVPIYLLVKNKNNKIQSLKDLNNTTLYLKSSSITNTFARDKLKNIHIINLSTGEEIYQRLSSSDKDIASLSYSVDEKKLANYHLKIADKIYGKYSEVAIGINKKYPLLQSIINKTYAKIPQEEITTLQNKVYKKSQKQVIHLTQKEKNWMTKHPRITVGGGPDWAPFDFVDSKGEYTGISKDYLDLISQKTGLKFEIKVDKWSNNLQKMKDEKIDLLHALYYTDERAEYMHYTQSYFQMLEYFFIRG